MKVIYMVDEHADRSLNECDSPAFDDEQCTTHLRVTGGEDVHSMLT